MLQKPATGLKGFLLFESMIPLTELHAEDGGFLVNGVLVIVIKQVEKFLYIPRYEIEPWNLIVILTRQEVKKRA